MSREDQKEEVERLKDIWRTAAREPCKSPFDELVLEALGILTRHRIRELDPHPSDNL